MVSRMSLPLLVTLVSVLSYLQPVESATCPQPVTRYFACAYQATTYQHRVYYVSCGFLGWSRCTKYRQVPVQSTAYKACSRVTTVQMCCSGWSGPGCRIHNHPPVAIYCPTDRTVRAALIDSPAQVSWSPPRFTEPYGFTLRIQSPYPDHHASLPIGTNAIRYVATSTNNNRQATCSFIITVQPPLPVPEVERYNNLDELSMELEEVVTLRCKARAASTALRLDWYFNDRMIDSGTRYTTSLGTTLPNLWDSQNELTFTATRDMDRRELVCKGQGLNPSTDVTLSLSVHYEVTPEVLFCPPDQTIETADGGASVSWPEPAFIEPNGETIRVTGNLVGDHLEYLPMGEHVVRYVATNTRSLMTAVCEFTISIQAPQCPDPTPPANGAVVCGFWSESYARICSVMCNDQWDVPQSSPVYKSHICDISGQWLPPFEPVDCSERSGNRSTYQHYPGSCDHQEATAHQETNFFNLVTSSTLDALVSDEGNDGVIMNIQC